jgi:hypothetical protein
MLDHLRQSYTAYKTEGQLFGYSDSVLDFLKLYFVDRIYKD